MAFGINGFANFTSTKIYNGLEDLKVVGDKIYVGGNSMYGYIENGISYAWMEAYVFRLTAAGVKDSTFGVDGEVRVPAMYQYMQNFDFDKSGRLFIGIGGDSESPVKVAVFDAASMPIDTIVVPQLKKGLTVPFYSVGYVYVVGTSGARTILHRRYFSVGPTTIRR